MTDAVDRKIKEILSKTNNQAKLAEQAVYALIERDHKFLRGLVDHYLPGIVAHAIERARKGAGSKLPPPPPPKPATKSTAPAVKPLPKVAAKSTKDADEKSVDKLLNAWAKKFEPEVAPKKPASKVSQKHMDAMNVLVTKKMTTKDKH